MRRAEKQTKTRKGGEGHLTRGKRERKKEKTKLRRVNIESGENWQSGMPPPKRGIQVIFYEEGKSRLSTTWGERGAEIISLHTIASETGCGSICKPLREGKKKEFCRERDSNRREREKRGKSLLFPENWRNTLTKVCQHFSCR